MAEILYMEGVFQIANIFLSVVAIAFALPLFRRYNNRQLKPFWYLMVALVLFDLVLIFGVLRSFGIYENPYITHVLPGVILIVLMYALSLEIHLRGEK